MKTILLLTLLGLTGCDVYIGGRMSALEVNDKVEYCRSNGMGAYYALDRWNQILSVSCIDDKGRKSESKPHRLGSGTS